MANKLAAETSPYLLQHKDNPVAWYPWGPEALEKAKLEDKPIFLSIGYSACHWCHVMEHESFENDEIAAKLNEHFVSIKVDREERPDLDQIYMNAVQILTGRGGWPMSVFLTPDREPFFGGTYWPPRASRGMPGFDQVLDAVLDAWQNRRDQALQAAGQLTERLSQIASSAVTAEGDVAPELLDHAARQLERQFDFSHGGFGGAPKFPHSMDLQVLLRHWRRYRRDGVLEMVQLTLDKMAAGGIYDHLGGGFARYSVDARWLVPHFEKMLYDNALLSAAYLDGYLATGDERYARVARETLDYILRDMTSPAGGFYSTEDADSEGVEGKFYVWTPAEIEEVLGPQQAKTFCYCYDVTEEGNFEGKNILNLPKPIPQCAKLLSRDPEELKAELAESRQKLFAAREQRVRPALDDKVLVSWNGLMIDSLARAARALGEPRYLRAAKQAADFLLGTLRREDGRLLHAWRGGQAKLDAYLDDYAALAGGLVSLYEAGGEQVYAERAVALCDALLELFADPEGAGFFYTAHDHENLIARNKDFQDGSVPSGNSLAATALLRVGHLSGETKYLEAAESTLKGAAELIQQYPQAAGQLLLACDMYIGPTREIVIAGDPTTAEMQELISALSSRFIPNKVVLLRDVNKQPAAALAPVLADKETVDGQLTAYICEGFACQAPAVGKEAILRAWYQLSE